MNVKDVYGNGKCGISIPPMGFPWEWKSTLLKLMGMGIAQMRMLIIKVFLFKS